MKEWMSEWMNTLFYLEITRAIYENHMVNIQHINRKEKETVKGPREDWISWQFMWKISCLCRLRIYFSGSPFWEQCSPNHQPKWLRWELGSSLWGLDWSNYFLPEVSTEIWVQEARLAEEKSWGPDTWKETDTGDQRAKWGKPGQEHRIKMFKPVKHRDLSGVGY